MTSALAALLALVAAYCLVRAVVPAWRPHGAAVEVWHVAMAAAMALMLALPTAPEAALVQLLLFCVGLAWCLEHLVAGSARAVHLRLAAGFGAMLVMLGPAAFAPASAAAAMPGMRHGAAGAGAVATGWMVVPLAAMMLFIGVAAAVAVVRADGWPTRLGAGCELVMAGGIAAMLVAA